MLNVFREIAQYMEAESEEMERTMEEARSTNERDLGAGRWRSIVAAAC